MVKIGMRNPTFNRFRLIHPCDGRTDRQTGASIWRAAR